MKFAFFSIILFIFIQSMSAQDHPSDTPPTIIYLIPGQGSDYRVFKNLSFDSSFEIRNIYYSVPEKKMQLPDFARELSAQIDTSRNFILIGVSLGGMIASEMNEFLSPEKTILISSAKNRKELPFRYRFQRIIPLYKIFPKRVLKGGAFIMQPLVEPDRNKDKDTFVGMLKDKDPDFLKRTIGMIMQWDRTEYNKNILHIHGDKDKTIPIRNVKYDHLVPKGSHMMVLTRGEEISAIINTLLLN